jgi:hypothetical protein
MRWIITLMVILMACCGSFAGEKEFAVCAVVEDIDMNEQLIWTMMPDGSEFNWTRNISYPYGVLTSAHYDGSDRFLAFRHEAPQAGVGRTAVINPFTGDCFEEEICTHNSGGVVSSVDVRRAGKWNVSVTRRYIHIRS